MYCSEKCRVDAHRKKNPKPTKSSRQEVLFEIPGESKPIKTTIPTDELTKDAFDRMCDGRLEDELRFARDILRAALMSPDTPPSALASMAKQYVEITEKLAGVVDDEKENNEDMDSEVTFDAVFTPDQS